MQDLRANSASPLFFPAVSLSLGMPAFLLAILLLPVAHPLVYSTLEMEAISQVGDPVEGVHFFLECKMTVATVERYLCTSTLNGTCKSPCMDCSNEEGAQIRATHGNQTLFQEIPLWQGNETCKSFHEPMVALGTFIFEVEEEEEAEPEEVEGAEENLPENTSIETREFYLGETEEYEYVSYLKENEEEGGGESCLPAFILLPLLLLCFCRGSK